MKIVMVSNDYLPQIGGVANHIYNLSRAMAKLGQEVHVVNAKRYEASSGSTVEKDVITVHRLYLTSNIRKMGYSYLKYSFALSNYIRQKIGGFDILHQHDYLTSNLACFLASLKGRPWLWTNHTSGFIADASEKKAKIFMVKKAYSKTGAVIAPSREIEMLSKKIWPKKNIFYIANGVDIEKFHPGGKKEDANKVILCPRRWVPKNGIVYLIKAAAILKKSGRLNNKVKFIFAGSGEDSAYARELLSIIEKENLKENIFLAGKVSYSQMPAYNAMADIVVIPSLIEAISLSALEAMACGKPVIASNVGGLPEIIQNNKTGILVEPKNPEILADTIDRLLKNPILPDILGSKARKLVEEKYSWENIAAQTLKVYGTLIN